MKTVILTSLMLCVAGLNTACASMYPGERHITFNRCYVPSCERAESRRFASPAPGVQMDRIARMKNPNIDRITSNPQVEINYDGTATVIEGE